MNILLAYHTASLTIKPGMDYWLTLRKIWRLSCKSCKIDSSPSNGIFAIKDLALLGLSQPGLIVPRPWLHLL